MINLAQKNDAVKVAEIHKQEIKKGFLSSLPLLFLEKLYISVISKDFCVVAKENNEIIGFAAGTEDLSKLYRYFFRNYFIYSAVILLPKVFNFRKIVEVLFYPQKEKGIPSAELLTIAVKKDFQGQGVAGKMLELFVSEMRKRNRDAFKVLVGEELKPAIKFYEKSGFRLLKETEVHKGQKSRIYIYEL